MGHSRWSSGKPRRRLILILVAVLVSALGCAAVISRPVVGPYRALEQRPSSGGTIKAHFFGTSSLLFRDDSTAILIDGFVSRPSFWRVVLGLIGPDTARIDSIRNKLRLTSLAAVVASHSDYDHAMDAPEFALRTGAVLIGSESTRQIGLGAGLDRSRIRVVRHGDTARYGAFHLTFLRSRHASPNFFPGTVDAPLRPPSWAGAWRTDTVYSVLIQHRDRSILVHGSANFEPGALNGQQAEVVYLASSGLGRKKESWVDKYWKEVVRDRGARRVILVHWDNFFDSLDKPLTPLPIERFARSMQRVLARAGNSVEVRLPVLGDPTDPFENLPAPPRPPAP